jgi:tetratricopeptide (TPR) repeat protein
VLPLVLLLMIAWRRRRVRRDDWLRLIPFFAVAIALAWVNVWFQTHGSGEVFRSASVAQRLAGAGAAICFYLGKALLPIKLAFIYPLWQIDTSNFRWWIPLAAVVAITVVLWSARSREWARATLVAWVFFCIALLPVLGFTDVGYMQYSLVADRYQHLALIGVASLLAAGGARLYAKQGIPIWGTTVVVVGVVVALTVLTWRQARLYRDPVALYRQTLQVNPASWLAHNSLGNLLAAREQTQDALHHFEQAVQFKPDYAPAHYNLANALAKTQRPEEAIAHYEKALAIKPRYAEAHANLGNVLVSVGRFQRAVDHYASAVEINPNLLGVHSNLGNLLLEDGQVPQAIACFEHALRCDPDFAEARFGMGNALARAGDVRQSIEQFQLAIKLRPDFARAHFNLANMLSRDSRLTDAIVHYRRAVEIDPQFAEAHFNLGNALVNADQPREAIESYRQALRLKPDYAAVYANLAVAYGLTGQHEPAVEAATSGIRLAQSQGNTKLAQAIEQWLSSYRALATSAPSAPK